MIVPSCSLRMQANFKIGRYHSGKPRYVRLEKKQL